MSGLLGLLIASAAFALVGTVLRGILRPISWATLALAALSFGSEHLGDALNAIQGNRPTPDATSEASPTSTIVAQEPASPAASTPALATTGWQSATNSVGNAIASTLPPRTVPRDTAGLPSTPTASETASEPVPPPPPVDQSPAPEGSPPPISGLW